MSIATGEAASAALPVHPSPVAPMPTPTPPPLPPVEPGHVEYAAAPPGPAAPAENSYQPVVLGQAPPAAVVPPAPMAPTPPPAPAVLPTYGSDLRPAAPALPPPLPPALPAAAAVGPAAGHGLINQPAVVRQPVTPNPLAATAAQAQTQVPAPTAAAFAVATGATIGALGEEQAATEHLRRLLNAVARQQPLLAWAIGEHPDGSTVVVTDLASGWLPPGIEIPATASVLDPRPRRGGIEELLGAAVRAVTHLPGQHIRQGGEPVNLSTRPVSAPPIDDLGWQLGSATQWRDGLPRLAHTLARAVAAGTGVLDSEMALLREHLGAAAAAVLAGYPHPDPAAVGNWQLLACIGALAAGRARAANYHLAWFLALNP
ncbi:DUF5631 domain-containing protein [Mycolicibacterium fallax]|uniref:DUF5631 domain-containing protein n=2 Tax=Mycolicibacterium fallax TaxID=1793 RepID=UPI0013D088B9|nr:DUF5631 domain-containing protein [Mycolicibacterium fallax]